MIVTLQGIEKTIRGRSVSIAEKLHAPGAVGFGFRGGLGRCFLNACQQRLDHPALIVQRKKLSYAELANAAFNVAAFLQRDSRFASTRQVALVMENGPEYLAGFYGTLLAGGVVVPLPESIDLMRLSRVLDATGAAIILTSPWTATRRSDFSCRAGKTIELTAEPPNVALQTPPDDDLAAIFFTSGTTACPKGVMLSHRNLLANAESILGFLPMTASDRALALLPFCHVYGNSVLQTHVLSGATLVVDGSTVFPNTIVDAIELHQVTSLAGVPELFYSLLACSDFGKRKLPSLRYVTVAGGAMDFSKATEVAELISPAEFFVMYGQSEATARLAYLPPSELRDRPNSIGKAIPGVEIEVRDEHDCCVRPGQVGELCARGPNVMLGYWGDGSATSRVLEGGWLRTGDLATVDEEGFFYLRGRRNEQLKIRGLMVAPREIERVLMPHFPSSAIAVVPFILRGISRLALFISCGNERLTVDQIKRRCANVLARHELPFYIEVLDCLPGTASMKTDRQLLAGRAAEQLDVQQANSKHHLLNLPSTNAAPAVANLE